MTFNWGAILKGSFYEQILDEMAQGSVLTNTDLIKDIKSIDLQNTPESIIELTTRICRLVTKQSYVFSINMFGPSYWRNDFLKKEKTNGLMNRALRDYDHYNQHVFMLYEENFGSSRETILYLDDQQEPHNIPYLNVLMNNAIRHLFGVSVPLGSYEYIEQLLGDDKKLIRWCEDIKSQGHHLKHFAGQTNTRIGYYHKLLRKAHEVKDLLISDADINIDLGGGFTTPEISRFFAKPFISYDILSPEKALQWNLHLDPQYEIIDMEIDLEQFRRELKDQKFCEFDVFKDDFPADQQKYNIVSFGFLSSTVRSLSPHQPDLDQNWKKFCTTFYAVLRVVALVAQGKEVSLVTFGRPHLPYMNRLINMQFKNNRVIDVVIPNKYVAYKPFTTADEFSITLKREDVRFFSRRNKDDAKRGLGLSSKKT